MLNKLLYVFSFFLNTYFVSAQPGSPVIERVKCKTDPTQEYALYKPASFDGLLIFLDPGAKGEVPLQKYSSIADEWGLIMAGSNNSRNFNGSSSIEAFIAIYNDITSRFVIDDRKIWIAGFSGGARAAATIAISFPEITGVIGCGAGFAEQEINIEQIRRYAGIAGRSDMNFTELLDNSEWLDEKKVDNIFLSFDGGHIWPPVDQLGLAIEWLHSSIDTLTAKSKRDDTCFSSIQHDIETGFLYSSLINAKHLARIPAYRKEAAALIQTIRSLKGFIADSILFRGSIVVEQELMNRFSIKFNNMLNNTEQITERDWTVLSKAVADMKEQTGYLHYSGERCFDHCIRLCQEYYFQISGNGEFERAHAIAEILSYFNRGKPGPYYLMARASAGAGNKKECINELKRSIGYGLSFSQQVVQSLQTVLTETETRKLFEMH